MNLALKPAIFYKKFLSLVSMGFGVLFYMGWLLAFGFDKWDDVGVYSITSLLVGFGAVSFFTYCMVEKEEASSGND